MGTACFLPRDTAAITYGWARGPILLTLVGWLAMTIGLFRMFAPKASLGGEKAPTYAVIAAICAISVVLTIQAYRPRGPSS
jgi:hypothetical protein